MRINNSAKYIKKLKEIAQNMDAERKQEIQDAFEAEKPTPTAELYHARVERLEKKIEELEPYAELGKLISQFSKGMSIERTINDQWRFHWKARVGSNLYWQDTNLWLAIVGGYGVATDIQLPQCIIDLAVKADEERLKNE